VKFYLANRNRRIMGTLFTDKMAEIQKKLQSEVEKFQAVQKGNDKKYMNNIIQHIYFYSF
jgi:uncharacterized membrane protein (DUF106 family)